MDDPFPLAEMPLGLLLSLARREVEHGGDTPRPHLVELHRRPVFDRAAELVDHEDPTWRALGVAILRELDEASPARTIPLLRARLATENDLDVLSWIVSALGFHQAVEALPDVLPLADHPDVGVRYAVTWALPSLVDLSAVDPAAAEALFQLCEDDDEDIRFYALYAITRELAALDVNAVDAVTVKLKDDPDDQVRAMALDHHDAIREARRLLGDDHLIGPVLVGLAGEGDVEDMRALVPDEALAQQLVTWWNGRALRWS
ncbi:HEAT repeat domain-containing protein [Paractinoplanes atraurantiacus]|uniref:HEAT repeat-containing protein n=1 Tax=Paractinoplanes atraurantiacus TaxID=1036182 RepID=A0A285IPT0_9ACTN|nr:HEAT repeat domain-containing protein [Actinoplanes atraurantiacus]SNY49853.1 HEAT repeat-containing protein [Actinoplanes atraurantiacus]